jgi:hypothetical protein
MSKSRTLEEMVSVTEHGVVKNIDIAGLSAAGIIEKIASVKADVPGTFQNVGELPSAAGTVFAWLIEVGVTGDFIGETIVIPARTVDEHLHDLRRTRGLPATNHIENGTIEEVCELPSGLRVSGNRYDAGRPDWPHPPGQPAYSRDAGLYGGGTSHPYLHGSYLPR